MNLKTQPTAVILLAGGQSRRMGRDKLKLRLGTGTLLDHTRQTAEALGLPVHTIRRDIVSGCGPLGGILTALTRHRADILLCLPGDMPFISPTLMQSVLDSLTKKHDIAFTRDLEGRLGFPIVVRSILLPLLQRQIDRGDFALKSLAKAARAAVFDVPPSRAQELFNINSPEDFETALEQFEKGTPLGRQVTR